jgi:hypothetical protein
LIQAFFACANAPLMLLLGKHRRRHGGPETASIAHVDQSEYTLVMRRRTNGSRSSTPEAGGTADESKEPAAVLLLAMAYCFHSGPTTLPMNARAPCALSRKV